MIVNNWDAAFTAQYGYDFPDTYLCFDTEFTGSSENTDLILEIGHTMVEKGEIVDQVNYVLNWYSHPDIKSSWLDYKLDTMRAVVGPKWRLLPQVIKTEGHDPVTILRFYHKLFSTWQKRNLCFVAQNGQHADERLLRGNFFRYLNKSFELPADKYFDTGAIFKATQIWESPETQNYRLAVLPARSDTLKAYFSRVINMRLAGIRWSLPIILEHYDLINKKNLDMNNHHTAGFDSQCLHWIMEAYRETVKQPKINNQPVITTPSTYLSPSHLEELIEEEIQKNNDAKKGYKPIIKRSPIPRRQRLR